VGLREPVQQDERRSIGATTEADDDRLAVTRHHAMLLEPFEPILPVDRTVLAHAYVGLGYDVSWRLR
jgi:hypothetical protein